MDFFFLNAGYAVQDVLFKTDAKLLYNPKRCEAAIPIMPSKTTRVFVQFQS